MSFNSSELNDLASVDMMFAEMMAESGVNPIPSVCDGCDLSILDQDNKTLSEAFLKAEGNLENLISSLDSSMNFNNKDSITLIIDNLREKQQLIAKQKQNFKDPNFNFVELYTDLKKVQNKLGINLNCPEMNVLNLIEENLDINQTTQKVLDAAAELDQFLKEGEKNFVEFLSKENELEIEKMPYDAKLKIQELKQKKEKERAQQQNQMVAQQTSRQTKAPIRHFNSERSR